MSFAGHQLARLQRRLTHMEQVAGATPSAEAQREITLLRGEVATLRMKAGT